MFETSADGEGLTAAAIVVYCPFYVRVERCKPNLQSVFGRIWTNASLVTKSNALIKATESTHRASALLLC